VGIWQRFALGKELCRKLFFFYGDTTGIDVRTRTQSSNAATQEGVAHLNIGAAEYSDSEDEKN
jgi:hypothetical protein